MKLEIDVSMLSPTHVKALVYFINKYICGAVAHDDLTPGKSWTRDMLEEAVDKSFYEIFTLIDLDGGFADDEQVRGDS